MVLCHCHLFGSLSDYHTSFEFSFRLLCRISTAACVWTLNRNHTTLAGRLWKKFSHYPCQRGSCRLYLLSCSKEKPPQMVVLWKLGQHRGYLYHSADTAG